MRTRRRHVTGAGKQHPFSADRPNWDKLVYRMTMNRVIFPYCVDEAFKSVSSNRHRRRTWTDVTRGPVVRKRGYGGPNALRKRRDLWLVAGSSAKCSVASVARLRRRRRRRRCDFGDSTQYTLNIYIYIYTLHTRYTYIHYTFYTRYISVRSRNRRGS